MEKLSEIPHGEVWHLVENQSDMVCAVVQVDEVAEAELIHPGVYRVDELTVDRLLRLIDDTTHIDAHFFAPC